MQWSKQVGGCWWYCIRIEIRGMHRQLWPIKYLNPSQIQNAKPDANAYYRFTTAFLTFLTNSQPQQVQTSDGVVALDQEYSGPRLSHNDKVMIVARCVQKGRFEGHIKKIDPMTILLYDEVCEIREKGQKWRVLYKERKKNWKVQMEKLRLNTKFGTDICLEQKDSELSSEECEEEKTVDEHF